MSRSNPTSFDDYQYGKSHTSVSSADGCSMRWDGVAGSLSESSVLFDVPADGIAGDQYQAEGLQRRRPSAGRRLNSLTQVGGVNSIENFARSWTRAAGFIEVTPQRPSFMLQDDQEPRSEDDDTIQNGQMNTGLGFRPSTSILRAHLETSGSPESVIDDNSIVPSNPSSPRPLEGDYGSIQSSVRGRESVLATAPYLSTPLSTSHRTYGTLHSNLNESSMVHAGQLWRQQQANRVHAQDGEREPLYVREMEQDGKKVFVVAGQSTLPQTIFNSTNVLIGVGLLSLPMGFKYAGWVFGMLFMVFSALVTAYTARILAKCMDADPSLITFADLAFVSYGQKARIATSVLFTLELLGACVALIVLFADTLDLLMPGIGVVQWKMLCGLLLVPLNFLPMRLLSFSSVVGIFSCFCIVMIVFIDGFIKPNAPGSFQEPAITHLFPSNWLTIPLSFGLLMSPWGGHSVFPNIYRDMRHPQKFKRAVEVTFTFTYLLDCATAIAGFLMFGEGVMDEITANIINTSGYPRNLSILLSVFIAIIPLTKVPLNGRPIVTTIEILLGLNTLSVADSPVLTGLSGYTRGILKILVRLIIIVVFVVISIIFPAFDSIMAFMGSSLCFTICVILPLLFYLKIFGIAVSRKERVFCRVLIAIGSLFAVVGTVFAFLPKSILGATR